MPFNITPNQIKLLKKFIPADKAAKLDSVFALLEGKNVGNLQFKCRNCNYQGDAANFKKEGTLSCPQCHKANFDVISPGTEEINITDIVKTEDPYFKSQPQPQPPSDNVITSNSRAKIALIIVLIILLGWMIYYFTR